MKTQAFLLQENRTLVCNLFGAKLILLQTKNKQNLKFNI